MYAAIQLTPVVIVVQQHLYMTKPFLNVFFYFLFLLFCEQDNSEDLLSHKMGLFEGTGSDLSNLVRVQVYYENFNYESITEEPKYRVSRTYHLMHVLSYHIQTIISIISKKFHHFELANFLPSVLTLF